MVTASSAIEGSSTTLLTSTFTQPTTSAPGHLASFMTVTYISTMSASASATPAPAPSSSLSSTAKIALEVGLPIGVLAIVLIVAAGFVLGRRASRGKDSGRQSSWWRRLWKKGEDRGKAAKTEDMLYLSAMIERHEMPGDRLMHELPTKSNIHEMAEQRDPVELPSNLPVELYAGDGGRG